MTSKILFLDIDGVCNSRNYLELMRARDPKFTLFNAIDPEAAKLIRRIVKETKCDVALSSSWRAYMDSWQIVEKEVCKFISVTPMLQDDRRGLEIQAWLDHHPSVEQYAILDDDSDFLPHQWIFKTDFQTGLTEDIAEAVIAHLNAIDRQT